MPRKPVVDKEACIGCQICATCVPEVFRMGDDNAEVINPTVKSEQEEAVREAAEDCPVEAIIVEA